MSRRRLFHTACACRQAVAPAQGSRTAPAAEARTEFTRRAAAVKAEPLSFDLTTKSSSIGKTTEFPPEALSIFKAFGVPKATQRDLSLTSNPISLARPITKDLSEWLLQASKSPSKENLRFLVGKQGSGKSFALLQAVSQAAAAGWIVLYIPSAITLVDSSSAYQYSPDLKIFQQHAASAELMKTFQQANDAILKKVTATGGKTLSQIVKDARSMNGSEAAGLQMVFDALAEQNSAPVLLAADAAQALYRPTQYLSPNQTPYHLDSTDLSLPRALLNFATGQNSFKNGAVLFASSQSNAYPSPSVDMVLGKGKAEAYQPRSPLYEGLLKNMKSQKVSARMGLDEAAGLAEMLNASKRMRTSLNDSVFLDQYVATNGQIRAFVDAFEGSMA